MSQKNKVHYANMKSKSTVALSFNTNNSTQVQSSLVHSGQDESDFVDDNENC